MNLDELPLPAMLSNSLHGEGLVTASDAARFSAAELLRFPNLGRKSLDALIAAFADRGLPMHESWPRPRRKGRAMADTSNPMQIIMDAQVQFRDVLRAQLRSPSMPEDVAKQVQGALERTEASIKRGCAEHGLSATP